MKFRYLLFIFLGLLFITQDLQSQAYPSPRALGFSQTYATQSRGSDAIGWNPANLGYPDNPGFSLSFGVLPFVPFPSLYIGNNAISVNWFDKNFRQGGVLTEAAKDEILSAFPETGWQIDPQVYLRILGMSFGHTAVALDAQVISTVVLPRSLPELLLKGNEFNKTISLDDLGVESLAAATFSIAKGFPIKLPALPDLYLGVGVKAIGGAGYATTDTVTGGLTAYKDQIIAEGTAVATYSMMGFGYAFDIGVSTHLANNITANVSLNNLMGSIKWNDEYTETYHYSFEFALDSEEMFDTDVDSLFQESVSTDTSYSSPGFTSKYPSYFTAGVQYDLTPGMRFFLNYHMGITDQLISSSEPRISVATELRPAKWFPIRFGVSSGGEHKFAWGSGFGFEFKHYSFLFGFSQTGGFINDATGFSLALGQELIF